ncbi:MAG: hypothetical protein K1X67_11380 [Fimbriimonadaceae bacterium]|nr:hypothetical protein [Fimbriimonadaceae bacterium]
MTKCLIWAAATAAILGGCGGGDAPVSGGQQEGIFRGTLVDSNGATMTIETEQYHRGGRLTGTVRITTADTIYHGQFNGSAGANGASWTADLGREHGTVSATVAADGTMRLDPDGDLNGGGIIQRVAAATNDSLAGTYTLTWTAQGSSDNFDLVIVNENGQDTIPYQYVKMPDNGGFVMSGSVVGSTVSLTVFTGAGTNGFLGKFKPTVLGQQGEADFQLIAQPPSQFSGTWVLTAGG